MRISFMRWRPGSDGREPRERRKWLEISGVPSRARFRSFVCNRLWIGVLPAFVAGFGIVLLLLVFSRESTPERSLVRASIAGGLCVFGWILGIWAATGPDPEADSNAENPEQASEDRLAPADCDGGCGFWAADLRHVMSYFHRVSNGSSKANARCWRVQRKSSVKY